jgi:hypothetical protein
MGSVTIQVVNCSTEAPIAGATVPGYGIGSSNSSGMLPCSWPDADGEPVTATLEAPGYESTEIYLQQTLGGPLPECMSQAGSSDTTSSGW